MAFKPSPAQQRFYDWVETGEGNCILEAVAGAGKTTTILNGIDRMDGFVWMGVYNKKMADEIKEKVSTHPTLRERSGLYVSTFHSAGYSALRFAFGKQYRLETDAKKVSKIAVRVVEQNPKYEPYLASIPGIVSMAKNRGIGAWGCERDTDDVWLNMIEFFDLDRSFPDNSDMRTAIDFAREVLARSNDDLDIIDFDDMVYLPLQRNLRMLQHKWVLVDEAQDSNPTRRALARKLMARDGRLVAVGDPRQAIFGFTGADNDALERIARENDCLRLPLTVTYRCPKAVVAVAQQFVSHITAHDSAPEGEYHCIEEEDFAKLVPAMPRATLSETAILCRFNAPLVSLCFSFIRQGIPAKIEGRAIGEGLIKLATRWKVKNLTTLRERLEGYKVREIEKAMKKEQEDRAARIEDEVDTLMALIDNTEAKGGSTVSDLKATIQDLFADDVSKKGILTLCSAHKSKGLEWENVIIYGRNAYMPCAWAQKPWQQEQEINLIYVALTRAKRSLTDVMVPA